MLVVAVLMVVSLPGAGRRRAWRACSPRKPKACVAARASARSRTARRRRPARSGPLCRAARTGSPAAGMKSARPSTAGPATRHRATTARSPIRASPTCPRTRLVRRAVGARQQPGERRDVHLRRRERSEQPPLSHGAAGRTRRPRDACCSSATRATGKAPASSSQTGSPTGWTCGGRPPGRLESPRAP